MQLYDFLFILGSSMEHQHNNRVTEPAPRIQVQGVNSNHSTFERENMSLSEYE